MNGNLIHLRRNQKVSTGNKDVRKFLKDCVRIKEVLQDFDARDQSLYLFEDSSRLIPVGEYPIRQ